MQKIRLSAIIAVVCAFALQAAVAQDEGTDTIELAPAQPVDTTNVQFVSDFLARVSEDESFRDACSEDLDACLGSARLMLPNGLTMAYAYSDEKGHSIKYQGTLTNQAEVTLSPRGEFDVVASGGFSGRGGSALAQQWFAFKCYNYTSFEPFVRSCRTQRYCSCAENLDKYPCYSGLADAVMRCDNN